MPMILDSNQNHAKAKDAEVINALTASAGEGGGHIPMVVEPLGVDLYNQSTTGSVSKTINSIKSDSDHVPCVIEPIVFTPDTYMKIDEDGKTFSLLERDYKDAQCVVIEDDIPKGDGNADDRRTRGEL